MLHDPGATWPRDTPGAPLRRMRLRRTGFELRSLWIRDAPAQLSLRTRANAELAGGMRKRAFDGSNLLTVALGPPCWSLNGAVQLINCTSRYNYNSRIVRV